MKCSKYFGAKWHRFKVFWRQKALVVSRLKISVMIKAKVEVGIISVTKYWQTTLVDQYINFIVKKTNFEQI